MDSVFDPEQQHIRIDSKIVAALDRLNQAFRVLLWDQAQQHGLSPIQIQILVFLLHHEGALCRVGHLAREFGLTAATISDAVSTLEDKKLITRITSKEDRRAVNLKLTQAGRRLTNKLSDWADTVREALSGLPKRDQTAVLQSIMRVIEALQQAKIVTVARMCITCKFFGENEHLGSGAPHHCHLLNQPLTNDDLRIDCAEHEPQH